MEPITLLIIAGCIAFGFGLGLSSKLVLKMAIDKYVENSINKIFDMEKTIMDRVKVESNMLVMAAQDKALAIYNKAIYDAQTQAGVAPKTTFN